MTPRRLVLALSALLTLVLAVPQARADVDSASATNVQEGDNEHESDQDGEAQSGDAVAGQVVGVTSSGDASVDATNTTRDSSAESGDASGQNVSLAFVGQDAGGGDVVAADVASGGADNVQEGDNAADVAQATQAFSGDAVAGQVSGVVTSAGGTADVVLANTTIDADVESGEVDFGNVGITVVGGTGAGGGGGESGLVLSVSDDAVFEGDPLTFVISLRRGSPAFAATKTRWGLEQPPNGGVSFTYVTNDGTASGGSDYEGTKGNGHIPPGGGSTTVTINTNFDQDFCKPDETMTLQITSAQGAQVGDGTGTGTIMDFCKD